MRVLILLLLVTLTLADPQPIGGAPCADNYDCGGINAGACRNGTCVCPSEYANPNCNYSRKSKALCGGLQFICFAGVGGVGNLVCGRTGPGVGQLVLMLAATFACFAGICICCGVSFKAEGAFVGCAVLFLVILIGAVVAGFIWSIVDGALMLQGRITDLDGYAMY
jgi:hypothetical protein